LANEYAKQEIGFCKLVDRTTLLNDIMTTVEDLVSDTSQHVRAALGTQISGLAPILGKQEYALACIHYEHQLILTELSIISFPCSSKCSRMSSLMFACTLSRNSSWSTKVIQLTNLRLDLAEQNSNWHRAPLTITSPCDCSTC
jgi:hypothetical protein